jgi:hypothetical protein
MIKVARAVGGIPINGVQYLLNGDGTEMEFETLQKAQEFLLRHNVPMEDFDRLLFQDSKEDV